MQKQSRYHLMLYRNSSCVVVGRNQNPWRECSVRQLDADGIPIVRRLSGGGTVYHDMGNSNYSITMPRDEFDRRKNAEMVGRALQRIQVPAQVNERHDIVVDGRKVSGSAFKLVNARAYHHGTMLIDSDVAKLSCYLRGIDEGRIEGRGVESVKSPVACLRTHSLTAAHDNFCSAVMAEFLEMYGGDGQVTTLTLDDFYASKDVQETYHQLKSWDWTFGQTPDFVHHIPVAPTGQTAAAAAGGASIQELQVSVKGGLVDDVAAIDSRGRNVAVAELEALLGKDTHRYSASFVDSLKAMLRGAR
ncbi:hypothetical protein BC831DRAFT_416589 [Entophlyctis helioformis]|nr:hypothetical protein BC831DRAFT_416589 [Entophlyctis helioformis]